MAYLRCSIMKAHLAFARWEAVHNIQEFSHQNCAHISLYEQTLLPAGVGYGLAYIWKW